MKPTRALLARLSFALAATIVAALPAVVPTRAEAQLVTQADKCRAELAKSARRYLDRVVKARLKCQNRLIDGEIPMATDCLIANGDERLLRSLLRAEAQLSNIGSQCNGVNLQLLGFPGVCPDLTGFPFDTGDFQECVVDRTAAMTEVLLDAYYPPYLERLRGNLALCLKGAPEDAASSLKKKMRARERCLVGQDFGVVEEDVDCRAKILPYGPGTGDETVDRQVARSYVTLLGTIPVACADIQIDDLDYQSICPDETGGVFTVFDLKKCLFDVNRYTALQQLATVFPTEGICGDGNVQSGEECDLGAGNSNTAPDTCRLDCTNPVCSDGVTDPNLGEDCDDGNTDDTDCCSNACQGPTCGDGIQGCGEECDDGVDNANAADKCRASGPHACKNPKCGDTIEDSVEECDDGNTASNDNCSSVCFDEVCGDEIVQPPREQCDNGIDNANTADKCRATGPFACKDPFCGDSITDNGETCDDGNSVDGDGCNSCSPDIPVVCGDGIKAPSEPCDGDGSVCPDGQGCTAGCLCAPACPVLGELVLYAGIGDECATNGDCPVGTCDQSDGRCHTVTRLDTGWTGGGHNADINNGVTTRGKIVCSGNGPVCGECNVTGIDPGPKTGPGPRNCRCANNTRTVCDQPLVADADDCGGAICNCYFGAPFGLSALGTAVCVVNRFSANISGQANVDLGAGQISATLRTQVHSGDAINVPCPTCGGNCSNNPTQFCNRDTDCSGGTCNVDPVADDGNRQGVCAPSDSSLDVGLPCDRMATNSSFPALPGEGASGGSYSLDCMPNANISGQGLLIKLTQTTGDASLAAQLPCPEFPEFNCHCLMCSADPTFPCNSDGDCSELGSSCSLGTNSANPFACSTNADCMSRNAGNCSPAVGKCFLANTIPCSTNADCATANVGTCKAPTCSKLGTLGVPPEANKCDDRLCTDLGNGLGECTLGPDSNYCGGVVKANGTGILACSFDEDCNQNGFDARPCNVIARNTCFPQTITASGDADPSTPIGAATFCIGPVSANSAINDIAGLPGPGRVINQAQAKTFCDAAGTKQYIPGVGGCLDP